MVGTVEIHLPIQGTLEWIQALVIPAKDIERLTLRPLKWLRFATFAVCGAKGHLSTTEGGEVVDYENVTFEDLAERYFYSPDKDEYRFIDCNVFNDGSTSSVATPRRSDFRDKISARDVRCVITGHRLLYSDAAHIIPMRNGDDYISFIVRDRSSLYDGLPPSLQEGVNSIENGILLTKTIHSMFSRGRVGFLKTPNFAMLPADVPQLEEGPIPDNRTTFQHIKPPEGKKNFVIPQDDVDADWCRDELQPPPSILLDFMYGAAVAKRWTSVRLHAMLEELSQAAFSPVKAQRPPTPEDDSSSDEYGARTRFGENESEDLSKTMDYMLLLPMLLQGIPPQEVAARFERQNKEAELRCQERSSDKVRQWLESSPGRP